MDVMPTRRSRGLINKHCRNYLNNLVIKDGLSKQFKLFQKIHRTSANLRKGGKTCLVLVPSVLLSDDANLGFTLSLTPLR